MKFAALGRTRWMYEAVRQAVARGHECRLVATCKAAAEYDITERDFRALADKLGARFFQGADLTTPAAKGLLAAVGAEAAISVNWLNLVPEHVRSIFPCGVWNAHAGDLPRYRGNACPNWAIINAEREATITIHAMADGLDAGDILLQSRMPLTEETYVGDIYAWLNVEIPRLFADTLDALEKGAVLPRPQPDDPALSLRCFPRVPQDSMIDWSRPADVIARLVRASAEPFGGAFTFLDSRRLVVWRARAVSLGYPWVGIPGQVAERNDDGSITVLCGTDALRVEQVEQEKGARRQPAEIVRSLRTRLGLDLVERIAHIEARLADLGGNTA